MKAKYCVKAQLNTTTERGLPRLLITMQHEKRISEKQNFNTSPQEKKKIHADQKMF